MHVCFVCKGNICRSPVAQLVFEKHLERAGLDGAVRVSSAGLIDYHAGKPVDDRALRLLLDRGYPTEHTAKQIDDTDLGADLLVAMDSSHVQALSELVDNRNRIRLLRSFDAPAGDELDVPDPYYGEPSDFTTMFDLIEDAIPGLLRWVRTHVG
ncbi:low molecular weight protein-tyrosine-phosphatase [Saccharopolyspora sp. 5N708]|uniref:low molecular weight protein-tyrosine-phosphatase n=1 Tax=Saccharopolyspora sp. 5N708 TaxID=3457424 RepID=UPI003FD52E52